MSCREALLWVTDPWDTLDHPRDTTLRLMQECVALGVPCYWSDATSLSWAAGSTLLEVYEVRGVRSRLDRNAFTLAARGPKSPAAFGMLLYRSDPPVDEAYLHPLQLIVKELEHASGGRPEGTELVNPARVLLCCGEKTEASCVRGLMPPSLVATRKAELVAFGLAEGRTVAKPLNQAQSKGVQLLDWTDPGQQSTREQVLGELTAGYRKPVMLQRYLDGVLQGETRLWMVDGELVAAARKKPEDGSFRIDMDKGGRLEKHTLTAQERDAMLRLSAHLVRAGIRLAAVDLIDGYVTDFNFTSPGLLPAMEGIEGRNLAREVVRGLLAGARQRDLAALLGSGPARFSGAEA